jgi:hypothetical protein
MISLGSMHVIIPIGWIYNMTPIGKHACYYPHWMDI